MRTVSNSRAQALALHVLLVLSITLVACQRKAPGPSECSELARNLVGVRDERMLQIARVQKAVDEITLRCLLTPYDRELVRCFEESGLRQQCLIEFQRRAKPAPELELRGNE